MILRGRLQVSSIKQPEAAIGEDAEQLAEWSFRAVLRNPLLVHMLSIEQDLILAVQDLHWWIVHAQPEEVILKVADLHALQPSGSSDSADLPLTSCLTRHSSLRHTDDGARQGNAGHLCVLLAVQLCFSHVLP